MQYAPYFLFFFIKKMQYVQRTYRQNKSKDLQSFIIKEKTSDLQISLNCQKSDLPDMKIKTLIFLKKIRTEIEDYIKLHPEFQTALQPLELKKNAPKLIYKLVQYAQKADIGPMAGIAGLIAEEIGFFWQKKYNEVIGENGGDIFLNSQKKRIIQIFAGESIFSNKIGIKLKPIKGIGICTSSGKVGPSLSFGQTEAAIVISEIMYNNLCPKYKKGKI